MKSYQEQYAEILKRLIDNPLKKRPSRIGNIRGNFFETIRVDLRKEFPLMDIKWIKFSNILHELLWFVHGDTHIKYLEENGCKIWTDDAYRYYKEKIDKKQKEAGLFDWEYPSKEEFIKDTLKGHKEIGELDRIYGKQWREFNGKTDQLQNCINTLKTNPDDRRMIVTAHNPTDLEDKIVGLPSCHNMFQFHTNPLTIEERIQYAIDKYGLVEHWTDKTLDKHNIPKFYINLWFNIRSNDFFLGQPYNTPSYALLLIMVGKLVNMIPRELVCTAIDAHLYEKHIDAANIWLKRYDGLVYLKNNNINKTQATLCKSKLLLKNRKYKNIDDFKFEDFSLQEYNPQSYIKAQLLT